MTVVPSDRYLDELNDAQREAVTTTEGPLLVLAGAGSGKTRVLTYRVAYLLARGGVEPNEILAITFTNKAADEMRGRIEQTVGRRARAIWIMTFHAACGRILRREAEQLGYRSNFTIYDQADQVRLVRECLEELGRDPKRFAAARDPRADLEREEPADRARRVRAAGRELLRPDRRRRLRHLSAAPVRPQRRRLRRSAHATVERAQRFPEDARALGAHVPLRDGRRVPGHQPRPVRPAHRARPRRTAT